MKNFHDGEYNIITNKVRKRQRTHRVIRPEHHGLVNTVRSGNAFC